MIARRIPLRLIVLMGLLGASARAQRPPAPSQPYKPPPRTNPATVVVHEKRFGPTGVIPKGYRSYSLFLVCDPSWPGKGKSFNLRSLYDDFAIFGQAIGKNNLAVWFWKGDSPDSLFLGTAEHVDTGRAAIFCKVWHLPPASGPFLVVTSAYPDEDHLLDGLPAGHAVFALGGMNSDQVETLLRALAVGFNESRAEDVPPGSLRSPSETTSSSLWVYLLASVQTTINKFGCHWTFKVNAGPVQADLHSCHQAETK